MEGVILPENRYFDYHPAPSTGNVSSKTHGLVPVWGFGTIVASTHSRIKPGERVYGYLAPIRYLVVPVSPSDVNKYAFYVPRPHLPAGTSPSLNKSRLRFTHASIQIVDHTTRSFDVPPIPSTPPRSSARTSPCSTVRSFGHPTGPKTGSTLHPTAPTPKESSSPRRHQKPPSVSHT
jgi:hypothetical protein